MKRIGLLTMALVLALGSLGVAYAAWTDEITIEGSVNTGDVDLNVIDYSCTAIYKDLTTDELVSWHGWCGDDPNVDDPNMLLVASAGAGPLLDENGDPVDDGVSITFDNVFPCQWLTADFLLQYDGSVPVKLWAEMTNVMADEGCEALAEELDVMFEAYRVTRDDAGNLVEGEQVDLGVQLHQGDMVVVAMSIHLPQDNTLMNMSGSFEAMIQAVQWNEFEAGGFYPYA